MQNLWAELRRGARRLIRQPGFTMIVVLTLGLAIGANTAIFGVVDAVLFKALPFPEADRLVMIWERPPNFPRNSVSAATFLDWRTQSKLFSEISARSVGSFDLTGGDRPEQISGARVSANFFTMLSVKPALGRGFLAEEESPGRSRVVVLSHRFWRTHLGSRAAVLGDALTLDGESHLVVGVLPPNPAFDRAGPQLFTPLTLDSDRTDRKTHFLTVIGRLRPGAGLRQAQAEMDGIAAGIASAHPDTNKGWGVTLDPLRDRVMSPQLRETVLVLFAASLLILLIACANVANLTLTRVARRQKEMAIRAALGASRRQLMAHFLTESLLLSLAGGGLGLVAGRWLLDLFPVLMPGFSLPPEAQVAADHRVALFTLGLSLLSALVFGVAPAWQASKSAGSKEGMGGRGATLGPGRRRLSGGLVVSEVAMAVALLIGAGLLVRTLLYLRHEPLGFDPRNVLTMHLTLPEQKYRTDEEVAAFYGETLRRVRSLPGVASAAWVTDLPVAGWSYGTFFGIEGRPEADRASRPAAHAQIVSPDYFRALSIPMLKGRAFTPEDDATGPRVAIINETLARTYFRGEDPLGRRLLDDSDPPRRFEIVGVAGNVKVYGLGDKVPEENAEIYVPLAQMPVRSLSLAVRATSARLALAPAVEQAIRALDKDQPITALADMGQVVDATLSDERSNLTLLMLFAAAAAALSAIGIYGVIGTAVEQQTREIGIRLAIGARKGEVLRLMMARGAKLIGAGLVAGLGASVAATRLMAAMLSGVSATDPLAFAVAPLVLAAISLMACYLPARRAAKVDPVVALRSE